ncbi:DUF488 domain-containing protein [Streptomyces cavernicola]|uniref:DUF488 family protein n=1 Tax=Streptomyces cavernicola TaxID=3043613 RepID=A0ABT6S5J6_9ACTN|nr:DUF488 family protein [Streptomyces sp. B-S-A6]MDI3402698.1 DUF488 family protein [Streptomyces sp. B-S-A6]
MTAARTVRLRRVYETPEAEDGTRVLVDRLWPRGLSKADARIDLWPKDLTPSTELRRWFHGSEGSFDEFRERYEAELDGEAQRAALDEVRALAAKGPVTLLSAVKELERSHVSVLAERLR